jgi:FkbM family methyltransferase
MARSLRYYGPLYARLFRWFRNAPQIAASHYRRTPCAAARLWSGHTLTHPRGRGGFADTIVEVFALETYGQDYRPRTTHTVLDLGANVGIVSAWLALQAPGIRVFAYEPFAENLAYLRANVAPWPSITISPEAIGQPGRGSMRTVGSRSVDCQLGSETHGDATVDVISLGEAIRRAGTVDLLKMDIEGSEAEAFADPVPELSAVRCAAIEWHEHIRSGVLQLLKQRLSPTHHIVRIVEDDPRYGMLYAVRAESGI